MRKTVKHTRTAVTVADQNEYLPDTPYVAVFGTSHSYGCCVDGEKDFIEDDEIWLNKLDNPTINFSVPGTTNTRILHSIQDFLDLPKHKNCDTIIVEVRLGDREYTVGSDLASDHMTNEKYDYNNFLGATKPWGAEFWHMALAHDIALWDNRPENSQRDIAEFAHHQSHVIELVNKLREGAETEAISVLRVVEDLLRIRTMQTIARLAGKKFYWFCWDEYSLTGTKEWKWVLDQIELTTDLFESCLTLSIQNEFRELLSPSMCECGHQNAGFHNEVAGYINKHMK